MSESDREISIVGLSDDEDHDVGDGGGGGGGGGDDDGGGGVQRNDDEKKQRRCSCGLVCTGNVRKAKQVVLFPLAKAKKQLYNRRQRLENKRHFSSPAANDGLSGNRYGYTSKGCFFCFTQPQTLDSPAESVTSDPNDPTFSYEMLKSLIENNDFYSRECNPHLKFHG